MLRRADITGQLHPCETVHAITVHLRRLSVAGVKYGGGADTLALCGAKAAWDLRNDYIQIARCRKCRVAAGLGQFPEGLRYA